MKKLLLCFFLLSIAISLTACSSNPLQEFIPSFGSQTSASTNEVAATGEVGGELEISMDELDKSKMYHALDKVPGTATRWKNGSTGISYTIVPVKKVTVNGNQFCREYTTTATKNGKEKQFTGVACVGEDGNWKSVSN